MRRIAIGVGVVGGFALLAYALGLGIYAVAATRPRVATQPRDPQEASAALERLGLGRAYPFGHHFVLTPHGRMHFADEGHGPAVLCLHGNGSWSLECAALIRARSEHERVLAPDLVGFGLSEKPLDPDPDAIDAHATDLSVLLILLDLHEVQVIASASSTPVALALVRQSPERVRSTVLSDGSLVSSPVVARLARAPVVGELLVQGLGGLSPGFAKSPLGRVQGSWDERASSLVWLRASPAGS
jgi:pimeloyl-ACP methyl ester carboxylesterase